MKKIISWQFIVSRFSSKMNSLITFTRDMNFHMKFKEILEIIEYTCIKKK